MVKKICTYGFCCLFIFSLFFALQGCGLPNNNNNNNNNNSDAGNLCKEKIISVEVSGSGTINLLTDESVTISVDNNCISASVSGKTINVTGNSLGISEVTVSTGSGKTEKVTVRVDDPKALQYKGLLITWTDQFDFVLNDQGSNASEDFGCWAPKCPTGYYALGTFAVNNYNDPNKQNAAIIVKAIDGSDALKAPVDYVEVYNNWNSNQSENWSIWKPVPPSGYVALGFVARLMSDGKPSLDAVRCVREDLVANAKAGDHIYNDGGSGAHWDLDVAEVECPDAANNGGMAYLKPGTFMISTNAQPPYPNSTDFRPITDCLYVLNVELPVITDMNDSTYCPRLDSYNQPDDETPNYLSKEIAVPFTFITDGSYDLHWKVTNSPIYHVKREEFYKNQYFYNNRDGSEPISYTLTNTVGITTTTSDTYSHTVGVKIGAEGGCSLIGGKVKVEVSYQFGYSTTSSTEIFNSQTVQQSITIAAGKSGCLWQKATQIILFRKNTDWEPVGGDIPLITIQSFVIGEYPHN